MASRRSLVRVQYGPRRIPCRNSFCCACIRSVVQYISMKTIQRERVKQLRKVGKTYSEINKILKLKIPKGTLSYICHNIKLPKNYGVKVKLINCRSLRLARQRAAEARDRKQKEAIATFNKKNANLKKFLNNKKISKILSSCLYLAEGGKTRKGSLMFGNSDPGIIKFFLSLLRNAFVLDEKKFRCTLQCRADQKIEFLQKFWSSVTNIPISQFYKAQIDKRSLGKRTLKREYKGVCRLDYFSADVFHELMMIGKIITE